MKKLLLTLTIVLAGVFAMQAQDNNADAVQKKTISLVTQLTTACHLTADQASKITPFVQQFVQTKFDNRTKFADNTQALQAATKVNRQQFKASLKTILSEDQMTELAAFAKQQNGNTTSNYAPAAVK